MDKLHPFDRMLQGDMLYCKVVLKQLIDPTILKCHVLKNPVHPLRLQVFKDRYQYQDADSALIHLSLPDKKEAYKIVQSNNRAMGVFIQGKVLITVWDHGYVEGLAMIETLSCLLVAPLVTMPRTRLIDIPRGVSEMYGATMMIGKKETGDVKLGSSQRLEFTTMNSVPIRETVRKIVKHSCDVLNRKKVTVKMVIALQAESPARFNNLSFMESDVKKGDTIHYKDYHNLKAQMLYKLADWLDVVSKPPDHQDSIMLSICDLKTIPASSKLKSFVLDSLVTNQGSKMISCAVLRTSTTTHCSLEIRIPELYRKLSLTNFHSI